MGFMLGLVYVLSMRYKVVLVMNSAKELECKLGVDLCL